MLELFDKMPVININSIKLIKKDIKLQTLKDELNYYVEKNKLVRLKKWLYVTSEYLKFKWDFYEFFVANKIYEPSYISLTTALSYYNIFSESAFGFTSISIKKTVSIKNKLWEFIYRNIKSDLFCWFELVKTYKYQFYLATRAKALFDYFWYVKNKFINFSEDELDSFRLNLEELGQKDIRELEKYCKLSWSKKMMKIYYLIAIK